MGSFWPVIGLIAVVAIIVDGVVRIVRASRSGNGKSNERVDALEEDLSHLEQEMADARDRIAVLEKIVTDGKYDLGQQIDGLNDKHGQGH